jgi:hypothetical protein
MSFRSDRRRDQAYGHDAPPLVFFGWRSAGRIGENTRVSYDLAVWEGERPAGDAVAGGEFERLYAHYIGGGQLQPPTPRIAAYVRALLDRYPDIDTDAGEDSPWADGPLMRDASGPLIYFPLVYSQCDQASVWAAQIAQEHGLVCYDPQIGKLRP